MPDTQGRLHLHRLARGGASFIGGLQECVPLEGLVAAVVTSPFGVHGERDQDAAGQARLLTSPSQCPLRAG
jgi:hypothetical protein